MHDKITATPSHHPAGFSVIQTWLHARQELLVEFVRLAGLNPDRHRSEIDVEELQIFCEQLVDYVSSGHFEVYNIIFAAFENATGHALEQAQTLYPKLKISTDVALDFNDKYSDPSDDDLLDLDADLNKLGPLLENRFNTEDELMQALNISLQDSDLSLKKDKKGDFTQTKTHP